MVNVGIIGCGFMGGMHAQGYAASNKAKVVSVCDSRREFAQKVADIAGGEITDNAEEIINNPDIQAVSITLPSFLHKEFTLKAAAAGKHVFCEKPIALIASDAEEMIAATRNANVKLMVGMVLRFWPEYMKIKEITKSEKYGKLTFLSCTRLAGQPIGGAGWFTSPEKSGSSVLDLHIHDVDFINYMLGVPKSVYSAGRKTCAGWVHTISTYEYDGATAYAEGSWAMSPAKGFHFGIQAVYEDNTVVEYSNSRPLTIYHENETIEVQIAEKNDEQFEAGGNLKDAVPYQNEIKYWVECIDKDEEPVVVTGRDAANSLNIALREIESLECGKKIEL